MALEYLPAILGSAGLFGLIQYLFKRHDEKDDWRTRIEEKINTAIEIGRRNEVATTRLQLLGLLENHPENVDTIMQTAERYFVKLNGNSEAWAEFHSWAETNHIDTSWYKLLISKERSKL